MPEGQRAQDARDMSRICDNILKFIGPEKAQEYRDHFNSVDKDCDGILTPEELMDHFTELGVGIDREACHYLFEDVDANGDGKLQFEEFVVMIYHCSADLEKLTVESMSKGEISKIADGYNPLKAATTWRQKIWILFEQPSVSVGAKIIAGVIISTILVSCIIMVLDSMSIYIISDLESLLVTKVELRNFFITGPTGPQSLTQWASVLQILDVVCTSIFTVEFVIRISCSPDLLAFVKNSMNWVDFLAISPMFMDLFWLAYAATSNDWDFETSAFSIMKVLRMFRLVKLFKLSRYYSMIQNLFASIKQSFSAFVFTLTAIFIIVVIASSLLFFLERGEWSEDADPPGWIRADGTRNKPNSVVGWIYWCIICMTQVGYGGDAHGNPTTLGGYLVGSVVALMNIFIYAIPISILGARFLSEDELSRRTRNIKIDRLRLVQSLAQDQKDFVEEKIKNISAGHSLGNEEGKTLRSILDQLKFEKSSDLHKELSECIKRHQNSCHERFLKMHEEYQQELITEARHMVEALLDIGDDYANEPSPDPALDMDSEQNKKEKEENAEPHQVDEQSPTSRNSDHNSSNNTIEISLLSEQRVHL